MSEQWPEPIEMTAADAPSFEWNCYKRYGDRLVVVVAEPMWAAVLEALAVGVVAVDNAGYHVPYQAIRDLLERLPDGVRAQLEGGGDARD